MSDEHIVWLQQAEPFFEKPHAVRLFCSRDMSGLGCPRDLHAKAESREKQVRDCYRHFCCFLTARSVLQQFYGVTSVALTLQEGASRSISISSAP